MICNNMKQIISVCAVIFGSIIFGYFLARILGFGDRFLFYPLDRMDMGSMLSILFHHALQGILLGIIVLLLLLVVARILDSVLNEVIFSGILSGITLRHLVVLIKCPSMYPTPSLSGELLSLFGLFVLLSVILLLLAIKRYSGLRIKS